MKVLILGGTRFVGRLVARRLLDGGAEVTLLHRGRHRGAGVPGHDPSRATGRSPTVSPASAASASTRCSTCRPTSRTGLAPPREALAGRVGHYVFISSGAVYRPSPELPWPESTPFGPNPIWGRYGEEKVASERLLWEAHAAAAASPSRRSASRSSSAPGISPTASRSSSAGSRQDRPILLPGRREAVNQFVYADDVARALVAALERPDRRGGTGLQLHTPAA